MTKKNSVGILWMLLHGVVLTLMFALAKHLNKNIPVMQIIFIYNSIALLMLIAFFSIYGFAKVKTKKLKTHFLRSFLNITGYVAYFYGLSFMTLDAATSVTYLLPIIVSYLGTVFYKEKMTGVRIFALLCGFIGIIIILKPWTHGFEEGSVWVLLSVFLWSACDMITKTLGKTETVFNQAFYTILFGTLFSSTFAYDVWISEIYITEIFLLSIIGILLILQVMTIFKAFQHTDFAVVMPMDYFRLPLSLVLGYLMFDEVMAWNTMVGSAIIITGGLFLIYHEHKKHYVAMPIS